MRSVVVWLFVGSLLGCGRTDSPPVVPTTTPDVTSPEPVPPDRYAGLILKSPSIPEEIRGELRALNQQLSEGIRPDENAAVLLLQAFGEAVIDEPLRSIHRDMLGIEQFAAERGRFLSVQDFVEAYSAEEDRDAGIESLDRLLKTYDHRLWARGEQPYLAAYLDAVDDSLQTVVDAARRPHMFVPIVSAGEKPIAILEAELPLERTLGQAARALAVRSMLRAQAGHVPAALEDVVALHRLARLVAGGGLAIQQRIGHALASVAYGAETVWLTEGLFDAETARRHLGTLRGLPPFPSPGVLFRSSERAILHEGLTALESGRWLNLDLASPAPENTRGWMTLLLKHPVLKWKAVRQSADEEYDAVQRGMEEPERRSSVAALAVQSAKMDDWIKTSPPWVAALPLTLWFRPETGSRYVGQAVAYFAMPAFGDVREGYDRAVTRQLLTEVGLVLAIFRHDHGDWPEGLEQLAPEFFPAPPADPCTGRPLTYHKLGRGGCRFYSWGTNGVDNGGQTFNRERTTDDLVIEFPERESSPSDQ